MILETIEYILNFNRIMEGKYSGIVPKLAKASEPNKGKKSMLLKDKLRFLEQYIKNTMGINKDNPASVEQESSIKRMCELAGKIDDIDTAERLSFELVMALKKSPDDDFLKTFSKSVQSQMIDLQRTSGQKLPVPESLTNLSDWNGQTLTDLLNLKTLIVQKWHELFKVDSGHITSAPLEENEDAKTQWAFHMTSWGNLISIWRNGLDPAKGGDKGNGACVTGGDEHLQKSSTEQSRGVVAVGLSNNTLAPYIHMRGAFADLIPGQPAANYEVVLRFNYHVADDWEIDKQHLAAKQTHQRIGPELIEVLTDTGWTPLKSLDIQAIEQLVTITEEIPKPKRLALTFEQFQSEFGHDPRVQELLSTSDADTIYSKIKSLEKVKIVNKKKQSFVYVGTTAHPIHQYKQWTFIVDADKAIMVSNFQEEAQQNFNKNFLSKGTKGVIASFPAPASKAKGKK